MKRRGKFRTTLKRGKSTVYAIRTKDGRFSNIESLGKASKADRRKKSTTIVRSGLGWRGDRPRAKRR